MLDVAAGIVAPLLLKSYSGLALGQVGLTGKEVVALRR